MVRKFKQALLISGFALLTGGVLAPVMNVAAVDPTAEIQKGINASGGTSTAGSASLKNSIGTITDVLLFIVGAIAVIMIVVGGLRYVLSGGDSNAVSSAKNTILYAVVGLIVALLAYAIVRWVVGEFS